MENNKGVEGEEAKTEQDTPEEDPVKKELETKNREIIDLKVNPSFLELVVPSSAD